MVGLAVVIVVVVVVVVVVVDFVVKYSPPVWATKVDK